MPLHYNIPVIFFIYLIYFENNEALNWARFFWGIRYTCIYFILATAFNLLNLISVNICYKSYNPKSLLSRFKILSNQHNVNQIKSYIIS